VAVLKLLVNYLRHRDTELFRLLACLVSSATFLTANDICSSAFWVGQLQSCIYCNGGTVFDAQGVVDLMNQAEM